GAPERVGNISASAPQYGQWIAPPVAHAAVRRAPGQETRPPVHSDAATRRGRPRRDTDTAAAPWHADWTRRSAPDRSSHTARYSACLLRPSALPLHMYGAPLCQRPQQATDQCCATCRLMLVSTLAAFATSPDWPCLPSLRSARLGRTSCGGVLL